MRDLINFTTIKLYCKDDKTEVYMLPYLEVLHAKK